MGKSWREKSGKNYKQQPKKSKKQNKWKDSYSYVDIKRADGRQPDDWKDWE